MFSGLNPSPLDIPVNDRPFRPLPYANNIINLHRAIKIGLSITPIRISLFLLYPPPPSSLQPPYLTPP